MISQNSGKKHCTKGQFPYSLCQHIIPSNKCEIEEAARSVEIEVATVIQRAVGSVAKRLNQRYLIYISTVP